MNEARSIKQMLVELPDFRNLGVTLRILLLGNSMALMAALLQAKGWTEITLQIMQIATLLTPVMMACLLLLWLSQPWMNHLPYRQGVLMINFMVSAITLLIYYYGGELYRSSSDEYFDMLRYVLISIAMCNLLLMYFRWRTQVLSQAIPDARLQVLRARIRPHFLYNTINAVLAIVRSQPKQAETALEDMADLFRMAMSDEQDLRPLYKEVGLCKQYLALEQLRLGDRLRVDWQIQAMPEEVQIPALLLQPLLENAVYHGIESLVEGGCIQVLLRRNGGMLQIAVENPCVCDGSSHEGNKLALQNIRERLALLFDVEANYQVSRGKNYYRVDITLPYLTGLAR